MLQIKETILLFSVFIALSASASAQTPSVNSLVCESSLIDSGQSPVVITFDHIETSQYLNGKKANVYWLKLRNNTKCEIGVEAAESAGGLKIARDENGQFLRQPNGGLKIEHSDSFYNGSTAPIIYHLLNSRQKSIGVGNSEGCIVTSAFIRSNHTVLFQVGSPDLKRGHILTVSYEYKGEQAKPNQRLFAHQARFAFNALPPEAFNKQTATK